jgi:hypothetical protein
MTSSRFAENPHIYDQVICLSEAARRDPMPTIRDFFAEYRLGQLREIQDRIEKTCLTAEGPVFNNAEARSALLRYNDKLIGLLEAVSQLQGMFASSRQGTGRECTTNKPILMRHDYTQVASLVRGIHDVGVDVANLCVIIVHAWTEKVSAEMKLTRLRSRKAASPPDTPSVDLDKLQAMALTLQDKLATLTAMALEVLIKEMGIPGGRAE